MKLWRNVLVDVDGREKRDALEKPLLDADAFGGRVIVKAISAEDVRQMTVSGTAALHLLRASQVPVWLYAPPARRSGRVVAAVNLSDTASEREKLNEQVVLAATRLSLLEPAELHVVCVADRARDRLYESILRPQQYRRYLAKDRSELRRSLTDLTRRLGPRAVPHLVEGNALEVLEKIVFDLEADVVTLGRDDADARAGVGGYFAERLFCRIDRSMLLVTPGDWIRPLEGRWQRTCPPGERLTSRTPVLGRSHYGWSTRCES